MYNEPKNKIKMQPDVYIYKDGKRNKQGFNIYKDEKSI